MRPFLDWSTVEKDGVAECQQEGCSRLRQLLRLPFSVEPATVIEERTMPVAEGYRRRRVYLHVGAGADAPVDIVTRDGVEPGAGKAPVIVCMQGTNSGAHLNLGEVRQPADVYKVAQGSALALQAADMGCVAVSFERACFGERRERVLAAGPGGATVDAAFHCLNLGQTLLGQTVVELEALRQWIGAEVAPGSPIYLAGYSAAGTAAIAAAGAFPEFAGIAVGGCVGFMRDTILERRATGYNDVPGILEWFEFDALLALVAPRPCLVVAGINDHIWPFAGAEKVVSSARLAWQAMDAEDALRLVKAPGGHTYYPELMWPSVRGMIPQLSERRAGNGQN